MSKSFSWSSVLEYISLARLCGKCEMMSVVCFFFQAEDGIRDLVRSRGLGDVYKRQAVILSKLRFFPKSPPRIGPIGSRR